MDVDKEHNLTELAADKDRRPSRSGTQLSMPNKTPEAGDLRPRTSRAQLSKTREHYLVVLIELRNFTMNFTCYNAFIYL